MADTATLATEGAPALSEDQLADQAFGGDQAQPAAEAPPATDGAETKADASDDGDAIEYFEDFIKQAGVDSDAVFNLKYKLKIDGEEKDVSLRDLVKINQLEGHVNKRSIEVAEQRKAFEQERAQWQQAYQERVGLADATLNSQQSQLQQQMQALEQSGLAQQDPSQYLLIKDQIVSAYQQAAAQRQGLMQQFQQTQHQLQQTLEQQASQVIRTTHPELADPASYSNALSEMQAYLKDSGVTEQNMRAIQLDPVVFSIVRDAQRYREIQKAKPQITQKLRAAPTVGKPGSKSPLSGSSATAQANLDRAKRGDENALAALIDQL
ncbi:MAG: hypothetical protein ACYCUI_09655 [Vulcanimicrobiaceae bacterium]|jgi:hypothetical protein